jgi:hypothetical protein
LNPCRRTPTQSPTISRAAHRREWGREPLSRTSDRKASGGRADRPASWRLLPSRACRIIDRILDTDLRDCLNGLGPFGGRGRRGRHHRRWRLRIDRPDRDFDEVDGLVVVRQLVPVFNSQLVHLGEHGGELHWLSAVLVLDRNQLHPLKLKPELVQLGQLILGFGECHFRIAQLDGNDRQRHHGRLDLPGHEHVQFQVRRDVCDREYRNQWKERFLRVRLHCGG